MKTSKFFLSTLIAAAAMSANAWAEGYTWDRTQRYSFTWDFSQDNTKNGSTTGVLGGTVTNTFATEEVTINGNSATAIKKGGSAGKYWELDTNSFFYDSLQEVTSATEGTGTLTFSVDYYWTGAQWGENILHIGCNGTGVAFGLSNGYISFATGTATDDQFAAGKTDLRLNANAWNTITWTLTGDLWSVSLNGDKTASGVNISDITWDAAEAERNKYSIGIKAPGWDSGATGLNDSGCKLANLSVAYKLSDANLVWAGGAAGGIWNKSAASWEDGIAFMDGDSVTFNTADATVTVSGLVTPGTVTISENTTFTGTNYEITPTGAVSVAAEKTLTLDGTGTLSVNSLAGSGNVEISSDSTLAITEVAGAQNETLDYSKVSGTGTLSLALNTVNGQGVNASSLKGTLFVSGTGRLQLNATTLGDGAAVKFADGADMVLNGKMTEFSRNITLEGTSQLYFNSSSSDTVTFSGNVSGGTLVLEENSNTRTLNLSGEVALSGLSVSQNKTVNFTGETELSGLSINSNATVNVSGSTTLNGNADFDGTLKVLAGGTLTLSGHDALGYNNSGLDSGTLVLKGESSDSRASLIVNDTSNSSAASLTLSKTLEMQGYATISASEGCSLNSWHGTIVASGKDNKIVSPVKIRKELTVNVAEDGELSVVGSVSDGQAVVAGLVKTGDGKLTLEGDNSYGYGTTISEGTLVAAHANALGSGDVSIATGAILSLGAKNVSVNNLSGNGMIDLAHGVENSILTINSTKDTEFGGTIAGGISRGVSLLKNGNGVLTLSGEATLGSLSVAKGTLSINPRISADIVGVGSGANLKVTPIVDGIQIGAEAFNFESGAHLLVDLGNLAVPADANANNAVIAVDVIAAEVIQFGGVTLSEGDSITLPDGYVIFDNRGILETYVKQTWSYKGGVLSLTLAIPEPSLFGLLAGLGALTLVGTRRRRSKKA